MNILDLIVLPVGAENGSFLVRGFRLASGVLDDKLDGKSVEIAAVVHFVHPWIHGQRYDATVDEKCRVFNSSSGDTGTSIIIIIIDYIRLTTLVIAYRESKVGGKRVLSRL